MSALTSNIFACGDEKLFGDLEAKGKRLTDCKSGKTELRARDVVNRRIISAKSF